jgi:nitroimidazol reductase NimA-like FMN-containing flavoprotein (pyridoxamine 5'-phosphate oxidase superfamily)
MNEKLVLDGEACRALLDTAPVGRIVYVDDVTRVRPVNYVRVGERIYFRSDHPSPNDELVTFEVDHIDDLARQGWSVIVRGTARALPSDDLDAALLALLEPWAPGPKHWVVVVGIDSIEGRWVHHADDGRGPGGYL